MKMLFTENWFIKAVSASPAKWQRAEKIPLIILSSWCFVRLSSSWASAHNFFLFLLLRSRGVLWPDRRAGIFEFDKRLLKEVSAKCQNVFGFCQLALFFQSYSITFWGYFITGLHIYRASSASGLLRPFSVKCGAPTQKGEPNQQRSGLIAESRYGHDSVESRLLRQSAQNFILNFAQGVGKFSEGGHSSEIARGTRFIIRAVNANSRGLTTMYI